MLCRKNLCSLPRLLADWPLSHYTVQYMKVPQKSQENNTWHFWLRYIRLHCGPKNSTLVKQKKNAALMFRIINTNICPRGSWEESAFVFNLFLHRSAGELCFRFCQKLNTCGSLLAFTCLPSLSQPSFPPWGVLIKCVAATTATHSYPPISL